MAAFRADTDWRGAIYAIVLITAVTLGAALHSPPQARSSVKTGVMLSHWDKLYLKGWDYIDQNYLRRENLADFQRWRDKAQSLKSREELEHALKRMLSSLDDDYTYMLTSDDLKTKDSEREKPAVQQVSLKGDNVGYIKLNSFYCATLKTELKAALKRLSRANALILDLRGNHGGYVESSRAAYSLLCPRGYFTRFYGYQAGRPDNQSFELTSEGWLVNKNGKVVKESRLRDLRKGKPLLVLVDKDTRSAAELLAGALRLSCNAVILGSQTFGKGVLQNTIQLDKQLGLKAVTAAYYFSDGTNIHEKGLMPDICTEEPDRLALVLLHQLKRQDTGGSARVATAPRAATNL